MKSLLKVSLILLFFSVLLSCKKDNPAPSNNEAGKFPVDYDKTKGFENLELQYSSLNEAIYYVFKDWYLWNSTMPKVNYNSYSDPQKLIDALKNAKDQWSFIADKATNDALFNNGISQGQGLDFQVDWKFFSSSNKYKIRVAYVYSSSPAGNAGMYRGMEITKINGIPFIDLINNESAFYSEFAKTTITYSILDSAGTSKDITLTDGPVQINTVLYKNIFNIGSKKVGYIVFNSFLGTAEQELTNSFAYFKGQGINELILDLRYNGGGLVSLSQKLSSIIAGSGNVGKVYINEKFNSNNANQNFDYKFIEDPNALNLSRVFIIGSRFTASASELVINGLKPYINVVLIGEETHGKPVGYFPFTYKDKEVYPVSFESFNANNQGGYYDGIKPSIYKVDGVEFDWGDKREYCLKEALYYIENGSPSGTGTTVRIGSIPRFVSTIFEKRGLQQFYGAY